MFTQAHSFVGSRSAAVTREEVRAATWCLLRWASEMSGALSSKIDVGRKAEHRSHSHNFAALSEQPADQDTGWSSRS